MTLVSPGEDLSKICGNEKYMVVDSRIPWQAWHDGTTILGNKYDGHVFLKIKNNIYYIGDCDGLPSPIMFGSFRKKTVNVDKETTVRGQQVDLVDIYSYVLRRFQATGWQPLRHENIARGVIWGLLSEPLIQQRWIELEIKRATELLDEVSLENLQLIYPMVSSTKTIADDIKRGYNNHPKIQVPNPEIFHWVMNLLT